MNYKKYIKIILRCAIYIYLMSRLLNGNPEFNIVFSIGVVKALFDFFLIEFCFQWVNVPSDNLDQTINAVGNIVLVANLLFFSYFYAKICGLYKTFEKYKIWQRFLIFILITALIFPVSMFDFKNFEIFKEFFYEDNQVTIQAVMYFIIPAFLLNLFFNFLTKKSPIPFEKIGYYCSIEFFKDIFKRKKSQNKEQSA